MREAPESVLKALKGHCPDLGLVWKDEMRAWMLTRKGKDLFTLDHFDGTPMVTMDGYADEVLEIVRRADTINNRLERLKRMRLESRRGRDRADEARRVRRSERRRVSREVVDVFRRGVKPMVSGLLSRV